MTRNAPETCGFRHSQQIVRTAYGVLPATRTPNALECLLDGRSTQARPKLHDIQHNPFVLHFRNMLCKS